MIKYRLHNITDFGVEVHDFYTENSLNNYIAVFVDPPYWVENLETNKNIYTGFDEINGDEFDIDNVSRETFHETPTEWVARHTLTDEKEPFIKQEKILYFLGISLAIFTVAFLLYLFLSSVSFIADYFSEFTWKVFNIL